MRNLILSAVLVVATMTAGCGEDSAGTNATATPGQSSTPGSAEGSTAATAPAAGHHNRLPLGEKTVGSLKLVATQDAPVKPGSDGAFDVIITGGKPKAVRFWVGTESAEGSVKAKADEETRDNWHTHAEVPSPLPAGSNFWVEVEPPTGDKFTTSFDLKVEAAAP